MDEVAKLCMDIRVLQRKRVMALGSRNMVANRLRSIVASWLGYHSRLPEADRDRLFREAEALIEVRGKGSDVADIIEQSQVGIRDWERLIRGFEKEMERFAERLPVAAWVRLPEQRGFGILSLAITVGECGDLRNYANPAKLWRRLGCAPYTFDGQTLMGATWKAKKELSPEAWSDFGYSPRRRSVSYLIGENLLKLNKGPYRARYVEAKAACAAAHPDYKPMRCHLHGMLLAAKRLLRQLWRAWHGKEE